MYGAFVEQGGVDPREVVRQSAPQGGPPSVSGSSNSTEDGTGYRQHSKPEPEPETQSTRGDDSAMAHSLVPETAEQLLQQRKAERAGARRVLVQKEPADLES